MRKSIYAGFGLALSAAAFLSACASGPLSPATLQTNLQALNADISTFNSNLNADLTVLAQNSQGLCNGLAILNAGFQDAAQLSPSGVGQFSSTENASYQLLSNACANPPTTGTAAAAALVQQAIQVQAIIKGSGASAVLSTSTPPAAAPAPVTPAAATTAPSS